MKKSIEIMISIILVFSLLLICTGCGNTTPAPTNAPEKTPDTSSTPEAKETPSATPEQGNDPTPSAADETPEPTPEATPEPTPEPTPSEPRPSSKPIPVYEAPEAGPDGLINLQPLIVDISGRAIDLVLPDDDKAFWLFDGSTEKVTTVLGQTSVEFAFLTYAPVRVDCFSLSSADDPSAMPKEFSLYGYENSNFLDPILLYSTTSFSAPAANKESEKMKINDPGLYQFYKLVVDNNCGADYIRVGEMSLYADSSKSGSCIGEYHKFNSDISNYTVLNEKIRERLVLLSPEHPGTRVISFFDNDIETEEVMTLQWAQEYETISFLFMLSSEIQIDAYRFTFGNVTTIPMSWQLYASPDSSYLPEQLILLDSRENEDMPVYDYGESNVYTVQNPGTYKYYQLTVTDDNLFGNDESWLNAGFREFTLLARK